MAGDWIKLRKDLKDDPGVIRIGEILKLDHFAVIGRLAAVWAWADTHADCHGCVTLVSRSCLDGVTQQPGFGDALASVGWLVDTHGERGGIRFPHFERHMGQGAKARASASSRKKNQREREARGVTLPSRSRHAPVTLECDKTVTREEKRREESKDTIADVSAPKKTAPKQNPPTAANPEPKPAPKPRPRNPLFDALAEVTQSDPSVSGSHVGKLSALLSKAEPPYTADDVREFSRRWRELLPWARPADHPRLTLGVIEKHIGTLRAAQKSAPPVYKTAADNPILFAPDAEPMEV